MPGVHRHGDHHLHQHRPDRPADASVTLDVPDGLDQPRRRSPATFPSVPAGASVTTTWTVDARAADVEPGHLRPRRLRHLPRCPGQRRRDRPLLVPYASISDIITNIGISDDATPGAGNLDGGGQSSAPNRPSPPQGITSGGTVTHDGLTFTWPTTGTGKPDNIVAGGQTVPFTGTGTKLGFLGTADYGDASGTGLITYTDGTTPDATPCPSPTGGTTAPPTAPTSLATTDYINIQRQRKGPAEGQRVRRHRAAPGRQDLGLPDPAERRLRRGVRPGGHAHLRDSHRLTPIPG